MATTDQPIKVSCSNCGKQYQLPPAARGKSAKCGCGHRFVVEPPSDAAAGCAHHPSEPAVETCLKCSSPICQRCVLRTKGGKPVCRPCAEKIAASRRASQTRPATQSPIVSGDELIPLVSLEAVPSEEESPDAWQTEGFPGPQQGHAGLQSGLPNVGYAAPAATAATNFGYVDAYASSPYHTAAPAVRCAQHPQSPVVGSCLICSKPICATCRFIFPPNLVCCPECAANEDYPISPYRKIMLYASLGCAIFSSLVMALLCSGLLSFLGDGLFADIVIEAIVIVPLCLGVGLGFGSWNRQEGNPALLWVGGIWNGLGLAAWLALLGLMTVGRLFGG